MLSPETQFTLRWGILATGGIAKTFTKDLLLPPEIRGVHGIRHEVVAAASSTSFIRACEFLQEVGLVPAKIEKGDVENTKGDKSSTARAYGSYLELANDVDVDIIYISTPHSHHYQNAMLALNAGKHVLCEKALTVNAAQAKALIQLAKSKNLFFMEAVWTRYFPLSIYVREQITSGRIGTVQRVFADNSIAIRPDTLDPKSHRMLSPDLAGGALLDSGIYALTWVFQTIWLTQPKEKRRRPQVQSFMKKFEKTGVDEMTTIILEFPREANDGGNVHAIATTSMRIANFPQAITDDNHVTANVRIQGTNGEIQVYPPAFRPKKTKVLLYDGTVEEKLWPQPGPGAGSNWFNGFDGHNGEGEGHGMFWEADECALAIKEGRKEGKFEGWDESILIMEVMDEVRKQGDLAYPEKIETTEWPIEL